MTRLKVGVIGCGAIAQIQHLPHLRELADEFTIGGLSDLSPQLLAAVGADYGVPPERRFTDYHELVESDIDAVIVCLSGSHAAPTIAAAEAGKSILVEKPMCTTVGEAEAMVAAAERAGVVLMVAYMKRHEPAYLSGVKSSSPTRPEATPLPGRTRGCVRRAHPAAGPDRVGHTARRGAASAGPVPGVGAPGCSARRTRSGPGAGAPR